MAPTCLTGACLELLFSLFPACTLAPTIATPINTTVIKASCIDELKQVLSSKTDNYLIMKYDVTKSTEVAELVKAGLQKFGGPFHKCYLTL